MDADTITAAESETQDGGAKRRQIMEGARTIFLSQGFDGASMNDIARVAGRVQGHALRLFRFEGAIVRGADPRGTQEPGRTFGVPASIPGDARELLRGFGVRLIEMMTRPEMIAHLRVVIAATAKFPRLGQAFYEAGPCHGGDKLAAELIKLREAGQLDFDGDGVRVARHFVDLAKSDVFNAVLFGAIETVAPEAIATLRRRRRRGLHARLWRPAVAHRRRRGTGD